MVNHCFGSKAGLVAAIFDSLALDNELLLRRQVAALSDSRDRLRSLIDLQREASGDRRSMTTFFEVLPHMLRRAAAALAAGGPVRGLPAARRVGAGLRRATPSRRGSPIWPR